MYFSVMSDEPIIQDLSDETSINTFQTSNSTSSEIESDEDVKERIPRKWKDRSIIWEQWPKIQKIGTKSSICFNN